jgi:hypothetical protein
MATLYVWVVFSLLSKIKIANIGALEFQNVLWCREW